MRHHSGMLICSVALGVALGMSALTTTIAVGAAAAPADSAAARITPAAWSVPLKVATGIYRGMAEVVDSHGHVIIAASGHGGVWYITDRSGSWTRTRILKDLPNRSYQDISVALDPNDRVYIAAQRSSCDDCVPGSSDGIFLVTDKGHARGTFASVPTRIAPNGSGEPSLKISHGHVFVTFVRFCCMPGPMPSVYLRTNATGHWTESRVARHGEAPVLRIGSDGRARVAFEKPTAIAYAVAHSLSGSFTVSNVPGTNSGDFLGGFALDSHDLPHLVWTEEVVTAASRAAVNPNDSAIYDWLTPSGWHAVENVGPLGDATNAVALDLDSFGHARIAAGGGEVKAFVRSSGHWTARTVATSTDVSLLSIRRALNGHAVIAWTNYPGGLWVSAGN